MLESLEGKRGQIRPKPPLPAIEGLFGKPTVVNNVLSLASVPDIVANGAEAYQALGLGRSRGTQVFQLGGNIAHGGIVEVPFGADPGRRSWRTSAAGPGPAGRSAPSRWAVRSGAYLPTTQFDLPMDYEAFVDAGAMIGHGGLVVFDDTVDMAKQARFAMEFCAEESCGKCTPCRVGSVRGVEVIDRIIRNEDRYANLTLLEDLCEVMADGSLCAMGGLTPMPVRSAVRHFGEDFERAARRVGDWRPGMTLIREHDFGTPAKPGPATVRVQVDGRDGHGPRGHLDHARRRRRPASTSPSCARRTRSGAFGSCRLCLVEVDGRRGTPASCTTPCSDGMSVKTQTPRSWIASARGVMELYFSDHPQDCLTGQRARGRASSTTWPAVVGMTETPLRPARDEPPGRGQGPQQPVLRVRCGQVHRLLALRAGVRRGPGHVRADHRRARLRLHASRPGQDEPFLESECVSCGACVQACPTDALQEKTLIQLGPPNRSVLTTCAYCGVGCSFKAEMQGDTVVNMVPYKDGGANEGHSCVKGRFAWGYANHEDRVLNPMVRDTIDDPWREVSWDEAIAYTAHAVARRSPAAVRRERDRRHHLVALHERGGLRRPEDGPGGVRQRTTSTPAPGSATRRPATASRRRSGPPPGRRTSRRSSRPT